MIPLQNNNIEEIAFLFFLRKEGTAFDLKTYLDDLGKKVTIQGVYKSLNKLIKQGILIKNKKKMVVSQEWLQNLINKLGGEGPTPKIKDGESTTHQFNSLKKLDMYWKHITKSVGLEFSDFPIFSYEPHEIWIHLKDREESQKEFFRSFDKHKRFGFFRIGGTDFGDKQYKKDFASKYVNVDIDGKRILNDYIVVIGDYIVKTKLKKETAVKIDDVFKNEVNIKSIQENLNKFLTDKQKVKLIIERNKNKAKLLRKKMSREFYIPQELIKKYDLF